MAQMRGRRSTKSYKTTKMYLYELRVSSATSDAPNGASRHAVLKSPMPDRRGSATSQHHGAQALRSEGREPGRAETRLCR